MLWMRPNQAHCVKVFWVPVSVILGETPPKAMEPPRKEKVRSFAIFIIMDSLCRWAKNLLHSWKYNVGHLAHFANACRCILVNVEETYKTV